MPLYGMSGLSSKSATASTWSLVRLARKQGDAATVRIAVWTACQNWQKLIFQLPHQEKNGC